MTNAEFAEFFKKLGVSETSRMADEDYYFLLAAVQAGKSTCIRKKVGAIIVDPNTKRPISCGRNGAPSRVTSCMDRKSCYRIEHNIPSGTQQETCCAIHAEANAIDWIGHKSCAGKVMYVYGHNDICIPCRRAIINAGLSAVYVKADWNSTIKTYSRQSLISFLNNPKIDFRL